ncbi:MAG: SGNH/GDSL hydrolase family protein [Bacteroidetes bacterium]|nr:SGNH/GDSL hydrolase family protein [Bacteroidota bacterium]
MKRCLKTGFIIFSVSAVTGWFFYQRSVTIYDHVTVYITGITKKECNYIKVNGISPFNRKCPLVFENNKNIWKNNVGHYKAISIVIPDPQKVKAGKIVVGIGDNKFVNVLSELQVFQKGNAETEYLLPSAVRSEDSFLHKNTAIFRTFFYSMFFNKIFLGVFVIAISVLLYLSVMRLMRLKYLLTKIPAWLKMIVISVTVAVVLFYITLFFFYHVSTYITAMLFICFSGWFLGLMIKFFLKIITGHYQFPLQVKASIIVFLIIWLTIETALRVSGLNDSYNESNGRFYSSGFSVKTSNDKEHPNILVHPKNKEYKHIRKEFTYISHTNREGLRDIDHPVVKDPNEYRIVCIGNSFTECIGAPQDSAWPRLLENRIRTKTDGKITVFNAGKGSSDPFYEYMLLKEKMLKYKPDLVLLAVGSSDLKFYRFRGGFERFTENGVRYREPPVWEKLYAVSYIFRYFLNDIMGYRSLLSPEEYHADSIKALDDLKSCIYRFYNMAVKNHFTLIVVFYDDMTDDLANIRADIIRESRIRVIDLFEYNNKTEKLTKQDKMVYYWPIDGHCNSKGYDLIAKGICRNLYKMGIPDSLISEK